MEAETKPRAYRVGRWIGEIIPLGVAVLGAAALAALAGVGAYAILAGLVP